MEIKAELNYLRVSPRKVRLVASLIKDMNVGRAVLELRHLPKRSAGPLLKLLLSAVANATHNFGLEQSGLVVKDIQVNEGPVLKRSRPRAFGRAAVIRKRTSHIKICLETQEELKPKDKTAKEIQPFVREAKIEDVKEGLAPLEKKSSAQTKERPVKTGKKVGFVRRMFRRKAI